MSAEKQDQLRVAGVRYLNARPLWEDLKSDPRIALSLEIPREVQRRLAEDEADVALMPVAGAATLGDVFFVPNMAIAARGPVQSVLLVSEVPLEKLEEVALDLSSRTSVVLAKLLLAHRNIRVRFTDLDPTTARTPQEMREAVAPVVRGTRGAVIIGDPALAIADAFPYRLDLAEAWQEWKGLPFVFAAWCTRNPNFAASDVARLQAAKTAGLVLRDALAEEHAAAHSLSPAILGRYLHESIRYDLGDAEVQGLTAFFDEAYRAGLLPKTEVRFTAPPENRQPHLPPPLDTLLARAAAGERLSVAEGERLLAEASLFELGLAADEVRKRKHPHGVVTYIVDRNVNYTNVCTTSCRFCAFYRPVGHPEGYVLSREVLGQKLQEVVDAGGVQILLQGGLNPELPLTWYEDLFRWMKAEYKLGLHALSPEEIIHISELENISTAEVLERLHAAGLDSVPGGGAEILVDRVRRRIAKTKCSSEAWLGVMRTAHRMGLRSSATMMYGTTETARERVLHLAKIRDLQDETGGFTAFFCWDFQYENGVRIEPGDTGTHLYLRQQALARLMLDNVDHIGASWVTQGPDVGQVALRFGADDFGSVMFEENVVSSAGTTFGINAAGMETRIREAGFKSARRNVRYDWLTPPL